ncbi:MAG: HutD family protein [Acidobacteria bacterium]|nr:HutD family protein [Acidobacteriota bacterium]
MALILRASDYRRTRWKNGGGETMQVAISPADANLDDFDWRISMATVASDGPFSVFAGVDRTLCIVNGCGVDLHMRDAPAQRLTTTSAPFSFSGDVAVRSALVAGPVTDFNVMTRADRCRHTVRRVRLRADDECALDRDVQFIFCESGALSIAAASPASSGNATARLTPTDTCVLTVPHTANRRIRADADVDASVLLVTISCVEPASR